MWLGYHRISRIGGRADTPVSEGEYREVVEGFAARLGFDVELLPVERDQTGSRTSRPILDEGIRRIEGGEAEGLIVVRYNRLSRATVSDTHLIVERIEAAGGQVRSVSEDYPDTPEGRMARSMSFGVSRMEWERSAAFIRGAKRRAVDEGIWPMPFVPFGYDCQRRKAGGDGRLYPNADAKLVARAFRARLKGAPWREVAAILGRGISGASRLLANRVYLGEIRLTVDGEEVVNPTAHEPIVDRATWEAVQADTRPRTTQAPGLLSGIARCASCSRTMTLTRDTGGYRCMTRHRAAGSCPAPAFITQHIVEPYVEGLVVPWLERLTAEARHRTDNLDRALAALAAAEAARDDFATATAGMKPGHIAAGMKHHSEAVDAATAEVARAQRSTGPTPAGGNFAEWWDTAPVEDRRHVLGRSLGVVWVARGRLPVERRVRVVRAGYEPPDLSRPGSGGSAPIRAVPDGDLDGQVGVLVAE